MTAFDYDKTAHTYDNHRTGGGPFLDEIQRLAGKIPAARILEVGAGTGNNTQAFLETYNGLLFASEPSAGMLKQATSKRLAAHWFRAALPHISLQDHTVDFVFGVYMLHHLRDLRSAFAECRRVLRRGYAAFATASPDFVERHPMNRYFPSFAHIDRARFLPVVEVLEAFRDAGFEEATQQTFIAPPKPIGPDYVERVANRFISTYSLIPEDEFEAGLRRLRADVERHGVLDVPMIWESVLVVGGV